METYVRYFVTQQLGTAYGRVEFDDTAGGHAMIVIPATPPVYRKFSFRVSELAKTFRDQSTWPEMVLRVAISQAHNSYARPCPQGFYDPMVPLSFATAPWVGVLVELGDFEETFERRRTSREAPAPRSTAQLG
jgi:hypothetical protein